VTRVTEPVADWPIAACPRKRHDLAATGPAALLQDPPESSVLPEPAMPFGLMITPNAASTSPMTGRPLGTIHPVLGESKHPGETSARYSRSVLGQPHRRHTGLAAAFLTAGPPWVRAAIFDRRSQLKSMLPSSCQRIDPILRANFCSHEQGTRLYR
jgi:hypothetical protein